MGPAELARWRVADLADAILRAFAKQQRCGVGELSADLTSTVHDRLLEAYRRGSEDWADLTPIDGELLQSGPPEEAVRPSKRVTRRPRR